MNQEQPIGSDQQGLVSARRRSEARWELKSRVALTMLYNNPPPPMVHGLYSVVQVISKFTHLLIVLESAHFVRVEGLLTLHAQAEL